MSKIILPDCNVFSEVIRFDANKAVLNKYYHNLHNIGMAITVWHELLYGFYNMPKGKRQETVGDFICNDLKELPLYHYTKECAEIHAKIRAECRQKGITLSFADSQIASLALANNAILITRNVNDFKDIDELVIKNWFE